MNMADVNLFSIWKWTTTTKKTRWEWKLNERQEIPALSVNNLLYNRKMMVSDVPLRITTGLKKRINFFFHIRNKIYTFFTLFPYFFIDEVPSFTSIKRYCYLLLVICNWPLDNLFSLHFLPLRGEVYAFHCVHCGNFIYLTKSIFAIEIFRTSPMDSPFHFAR